MTNRKPETGNRKKKAKSPASPTAGLRLEMVRAGDLRDNPANWRRHPAGQLSALRNLIEDPDIGWAAPLLYNERTKRLIDGHARKRIVDPDAMVPVIIGSWSPEAEKKILATLDPLAGMAEADPAALQALLAEVDLKAPDLEALALDLKELLILDEPEFPPADGSGQPRLDEKKKIRCPECGHEFSP